MSNPLQLHGHGAVRGGGAWLREGLPHGEDKRWSRHFIGTDINPVVLILKTSLTCAACLTLQNTSTSWKTPSWSWKRASEKITTKCWGWIRTPQKKRSRRLTANGRSYTTQVLMGAERSLERLDVTRHADWVFCILSHDRPSQWSYSWGAEGGGEEVQGGGRGLQRALRR